MNPDGSETAAAEPDRSWCIAGRGEALVTGPVRALGDRGDVRVRVELGEPVPEQDLGEPTRSIRVAESGVREFTVTWHEMGDGRTVARNPAGGNQVVWSEPTPTRLWFTPGPDALVTSVYQRFLIRHVTTTLLEHDLGGRSIHAVTAALGSGVLAVAGATCSGKTRLVNHLAGAGLVGRVVDDDCPVVAPGGRTATLVPRRYEVETATLQELRALVVLTEEVDEPRATDADRAHALLASIPVPWPASWLPGEPRPPLPPLPAGLAVIEAPAQRESAHSAVADAIARLGAGGLNDRR